MIKYCNKHENFSSNKQKIPDSKVDTKNWIHDFKIKSQPQLLVLIRNMIKLYFPSHYSDGYISPLITVMGIFPLSLQWWVYLPSHYSDIYQGILLSPCQFVCLSVTFICNRFLSLYWREYLVYCFALVRCLPFSGFLLFYFLFTLIWL